MDDWRRLIVTGSLRLAPAGWSVVLKVPGDGSKGPSGEERLVRIPLIGWAWCEDGATQAVEWLPVVWDRQLKALVPCVQYPAFVTVEGPGAT